MTSPMKRKVEDPFSLPPVTRQKLDQSPGNPEVGSLPALPRELILHVFSYLGLRDLAHAAHVSRLWRELAKVALNDYRDGLSPEQRALKDTKPMAFLECCERIAQWMPISQIRFRHSMPREHEWITSVKVVVRGGVLFFGKRGDSSINFFSFEGQRIGFLGGRWNYNLAFFDSNGRDVFASCSTLLGDPYNTRLRSTIKKWEVSTNRTKERQFSHYAEKITSLAVHGETLFIGTENGVVMECSPERGRSKRVFLGHSAEVKSLLFTKDSFFSGSTDMTARMWSLATGQCEQVFSGHQAEVGVLALYKECLITRCYLDRTLKKWDLATGSCLTTFTRGSCQSDPKFRSFLVTKTDLFVGYDPLVQQLSEGMEAVEKSAPGMIVRWDLDSGFCKQVFSRPTGTGPVSAMLVSGNCLLAGRFRSPEIEVWDIKTTSCLRIVNLGAFSMGVEDLLEVDGKIVIVGLDDALICQFIPSSFRT